jgi:hypothetical protein
VFGDCHSQKISVQHFAALEILHVNSCGLLNADETRSMTGYKNQLPSCSFLGRLLMKTFQSKEDQLIKVSKENN